MPILKSYTVFKTKRLCVMNAHVAGIGEHLNFACLLGVLPTVS